MRNLRIDVVLVVGLALFLVFLGACGGVEQAAGDTVVDSVETESQRNPVGKQAVSGAGKSDSLEVDGGWSGVEHANDDAGADDENANVEGGEDTAEDLDDESDVFDDEADEDGQAEGCVQMCAMLEQCHGLPEGVVTLEDCRVGCEQSLADELLMARDIKCVEEADSCHALGSCMENFWSCDEPCDSFMICELQDEPDECRVWCGVGIGSGVVVAEQFHCMERLSRTEQCHELVDGCGLDWML